MLSATIIAFQSRGAVKPTLPQVVNLREGWSLLHARLDGATFTAAFTEGWEMSEEQAMESVEEIFRGEVE